MKLALALAFFCAVSAFPADKESVRLIKTSEKEPAKWMQQEEVWELIKAHANFIDVTDHEYTKFGKKEIDVKVIPNAPRFQQVVNAVLPSIDDSRVLDFVTSFSSYHTRYYQSTTGLESQRWLLAQVRASVEGYQGSVTVSEFSHSWAQSSIIARIEGSDPTLKDQITIIGAHQDSVNMWSPTMNAPGADDNASGSVVVLETLRVLINSGFVPKRTLEFHWYAAEEVGLRGSADIARSYSNNGVEVAAMVNFDVPGYYSGSDQVGIYTDNTNAVLNAFLRSLVDEYLEFTWRDRTCGYGCSDHASWTNYGFPAGMPAEVVLHPSMHTASDNLANVGFNQVREFVKLSVGFMIEMGEPSN